MNRRRLVLAFVLAFLAGCAPVPTETARPPSPTPAGLSPTPDGESALPSSSPSPVSIPPAVGLKGRIVYGGREGHLWVINADGTGRRQITSAKSGVDFDPAWMGDKRSVVFRTSRGHYAPDVQGTGTEGIWVVDTATLKERQLYPPNDSTFGGLFPDPGPGDLVALSTLDAEEHELIVLVDGRSGRIVRRLDVGRSGECSEWSPDGRKIAYCHLQGSTFDVWVMNEDGSHQTRLTDDPGHDYPGQWSADGGQLTYSSMGEIWVMNADGTNKRQVTSSAGVQAPEAWLPDGRIVFDSWLPEATIPTWFVINADGSGLTSLPQFERAGVMGPIDWLQPARS